MKHQHSSCKPDLKTFFSLCVAAVITLIFFNSSIDEDNSFDFSNNLGLKILIAILSLLTGWNGYHELKDHLGGHHHTHATDDKDNSSSKSLLNTDTTSDEENPKEENPETALQPSIGKGASYGATQDRHLITAPKPQLKSPYRLLFKIGASGTTALFMVAAGYGLFTQSVALTGSLPNIDSPTQNGLAVIPTFFLVFRFMAIPFKHTITTIWGGHKEFTQQVTGSKEPALSNSYFYRFLQTLPGRGVAFLVLCGMHLTESLLLSNEVQDNIFYIASIIGLTAPQAFAHLNHLDFSANAYDAWKKRDLCPKITTAITGILSGFAHASSGILGSIYFWPQASDGVKVALTLSSLGEGLIGAVEHHQHAGRSLES